MAVDFLRYYDLESYLFEDVRRRFHEEGSVGAFDFFSIVIWKANRAKSKVAKRLLKQDPEGRTELDIIARDLTRCLHDASDSRERLRILMEDWGFCLPMATAILSVFWPDEFSVYDVRVCDQLGQFHSLANVTDFAVTWARYREYLAAVTTAAPANLNLRDHDRYLWGKSVAEQLRKDISRNFR